MINFTCSSDSKDEDSSSLSWSSSTSICFDISCLFFRGLEDTNLVWKKTDLQCLFFIAWLITTLASASSCYALLLVSYKLVLGSSLWDTSSESSAMQTISSLSLTELNEQDIVMSECPSSSSDFPAWCF